MATCSKLQAKFHDHDCFKDSPKKQIRLLVIGEAGQGKSSLVNGLIGRQQATEGGRLKSVTNQIESFVFDKNGIICTVWDAPGLGYKTDEAVLNELGQKCNLNIDLLLYCICMDSKRWPFESDEKIFRKITEKFGTEVWRHCVFVLTFANREVANYAKEKDVKQHFCERIDEFNDQIKEILSSSTLSAYDHNSVLSDLQIQAVPVGDPHGVHGWKLPDREDWFFEFFKECFNKINPQAQAPLLKINEHRLCFDVNSRNPPTCSIQREESGHVSLSFRSIPAVLQIDSDSGEEATGLMEMHERKIPLHKILQGRLVDEESGLFEYIKTFASERTRESNILAGFGGIFEAIYTWIGHRFNKQEQQ